MSNTIENSRWIKLPSLAAVAWIPFYLRLNDVPSTKYTHSHPLLYELLFDSGNQDPSDQLLNYNNFKEIIDNHDYRGALLLDNLEVYINNKGEFTEYNKGFRRMEYVGYTPIRYVNRGNYDRVKETGFDKQGEGGSPYNLSDLCINLQSNRIRVTQSVNFRICKMLEIGGGILTFTFRGAPYAWMTLEFTLYNDGNFNLEFIGSCIPSQKLYFDWKSLQSCTYDMLTASYRDMEEFIRSGNFLFQGKAIKAPRRTGSTLIHTGRLW